jgi:hypothetical protein
MNAKSVCQACAPVLGLLLAHTVLAGTTYYVKNGGNDNLNGTSDLTAWATIDRVHTAFNDNDIGPGDTVQFKCGDEWAEQFVISNSGDGTAGGDITIGAYGSGDRPIIGYDEEYSGWTASQGYENVYWKGWATEHEVFTVSEKASSGEWAGYFRVYSRKSNVASVAAQEGSSWWDDENGILYVHAFDDTDLSGTPTKTLYGNTRGFYMSEQGAMELGAIRTNGESYIKIQNIHATCQSYGIGGMNTDHILVDDCWISGTYRATQFGHDLYATTDSHHITTQNCEVRFNGDGLRHCRSNALVAHGNTISDHWTRVSGEDQTMMAFQNCHDVQVYDNDISDGRNGFATFTDTGTTRDGFLIHHNRFHGVINSAVWFLRAGTGKFGGDLQFYHNVFWLENGPEAVPQGIRLDAPTASSTEPYVIYNNTIHVASQGLRMRSGAPINLVLQNNIFYDCSPHIADDSGAITGSPHTRNYNFYYPVGSSNKIEWGGTPYSIFSSYQTNSGEEANGQDLDPDFLNDPPDKDDVKLLASGAADDAGDNTGAPFNVSTGLDFYGLGIGGQASVGASEGVSTP